MPGSPHSSELDRPATRPLILIVDDEPTVRVMVRASINASGGHYRLVEAATAAEAVAQARREQPDLVLLDVALPDHDGVWVCGVLKSDPSTAHIPILMLTAMSLGPDRDRAMFAGADGYIVKPFSPRALLADLDQWLA